MAAKPKKIEVLRVRTARGVSQFYRAGLAFGPEPRDVPLADLDKDQVQAILDEPMLLAERVAVEVVPQEAD